MSGAYRRLPTERANPAARGIDRLDAAGILRRIQREDARVPRAVRREAPRIARAAELAAERLRRGGRLVFVGAGTSGRLGVMEAAECAPTFGVPPGLVRAVIAGGRGAVFRAREGAEDDASAGAGAVRRAARRGDMVVGVAASGVTPFVRGALAAARRAGCRTALVTANARSPIRAAEIVIAPEVGPEIVAGSTRMKCATAAKLVLNALTTAAMILLGKVHDGWMVDLRPNSRKLRHRALGLVRRLGGVGPRRAAALLDRAGSVKAAVVMARLRLGAPAARRRLRAMGGSLRLALEKKR